MKVAVLGCGGLGGVHAAAYAAMDEVELTGLCDSNRETAEALSRKTGAPAFESFEQMLEEIECEAVSIALPSFLHKEFTLLAAKARKHIICEKPIALTLEDASEMIACCEEHGVKLFIGHVVRFFPDYVDLKQAIDNGAIGNPAVAHASRIGGHPGRWYTDASRSGGIIVDLMIHDLDFLRWSLGKVSSVYALHSANAEQEYSLVTLRFASGAVANVEGHWGYPGPFQTKAEIAGDGGVIRADSMKSSSIVIHKKDSDTGKTAAVLGSPAYRNPYELQLKHFLDCIRDGSEPIVSAIDARKALELALAADESARTGKVVYLKEEM
ncbi:Gfo/Idh/MocA family oxidoreductase [Paenibacillus sp. HB172176]|uniref:Gfo/Idh/MocA family protein n=1 Tax=Paenibacillus sp. HB172176 TaxID=2493690 RepID=UPI001439283F|nr:Gfo/Idh/MocA family oxidoreductase [Paenibacillus sp. HB172176]